MLLTCHNRKDKTLDCLTSLFHCELPDSYSLDVFLVDDGSIDGTAEEVKKIFPIVNIIQGNGNLYWNQGMRLAWNNARETKYFDFYLWLNDDTLLAENAIVELIMCYDECISKKSVGIISGACKTSMESITFSYGGRSDTGPVIPNGVLQECRFINGNVVLVSREIFDVLGNLSDSYTHAMGDFDYGLRAISAGFKCYTSKIYIAICHVNDIPAWCDPNIPFRKRWNLFHSPRGLNIKEYSLFNKKFNGSKWIIFVGKAYAKVIAPELYNNIIRLF